MASACLGGDADLVLSKARATSLVPGKRKVSKEFWLTSTSQSLFVSWKLEISEMPTKGNWKLPCT